ncbi:hypothetical protein GE21DRAFT_3038 [Neurospora crassa]|uniref:Uncharacterized protein n=2 Tax=Neurospora crassa TaxID=5141 RepID=Q7SCA6_NEUCR|nr:hypothetical protein NCU05479 [Neurospora crassa OR74A]EAA34234.1 hypothetical protein NCU05479 [Neurospora crassa OR74A]KHE85221.1 hypothetical protein GE21DRAFT_3038 [Neurospora crassa]CAE55937.1 conserved hypothetical protein [Neurospora crassa]|eukprot:XP_963470.1 hypothetical protein NCU05479 [Neurospora crassa OR74A]
MSPKSSKAFKVPFSLTGSDYKLLCGFIINSEKIKYDLASVTEYMGSTSQQSTQIRVNALLRKLRRDGHEIAEKLDAEANEAIRNAVAPVSHVNPRKRAREDNGPDNENHNVNNRHNPGLSSSSLFARTPRPALPQQQDQQQHHYQQPQKHHEIPFATYTHGSREFPVPAKTHMYETPPPPYTRLATAGTGVMITTPVINSSHAVNQGMGVGMAMGSLSGAERLGNGFRQSLDGDGFPLGTHHVGNELTFGAPTRSAPLAYSSDARNGFGVHGSQNSNRVNRLDEGYMGNVDTVNGSAMGFTRPNSLGYNLSVNSATFYNNNLRLGDTLPSLMGNDLANGLNAIPGNSSNDAAVDRGVQHNSFNPRFNHPTNSNEFSVSVPITTVPHPVKPVFQPGFQPTQNFQVPDHQIVNLNVDFLGKDGNQNGITAAATQPNGVQPKVTVSILEQLPVPIPMPAAEKTPERIPTLVNTAATIADADPIILQQQQGQDQPQEQQRAPEQQSLQEEIDSWDPLFHQDQEQLPQGEFDSVEAQVFSALSAEGYGIDYLDL